MAGMTADPNAQHEEGRGRKARRPREISARGWWDIVVRIYYALGEDHVATVSAGVAFYLLLSLFPALAALVSVYGLIANPSDVEQQLSSLSGILPGEARTLVTAQLSDIASNAERALTLGAVGGILFALWSATRAVKSLMDALNLVYGEQEKRGLIKFNVLALSLTGGAILFGVISLALVVALPAMMGQFGLQESMQNFIALSRWPLLATAVMAGLAILYRFGPSRETARWQWASWGAVVATLLWLAGSFLFSLYVAHFSSYNETYGSMGAVVILLMWFFVSAFVVLLGAELNAEMEHQTMMDTTTGEPKHMGNRGAYVADTLGPRA
jgi:membrane protein